MSLFEDLSRLNKVSNRVLNRIALDAGDVIKVTDRLLQQAASNALADLLRIENKNNNSYTVDGLEEVERTIE